MLPPDRFATRSRFRGDSTTAFTIVPDGTLHEIHTIYILSPLNDLNESDFHTVLQRSYILLEAEPALNVHYPLIATGYETGEIRRPFH